MATALVMVVPDATLLASGGDDDRRFFVVTAPSVAIVDLPPGTLNLPAGTFLIIQQAAQWTPPEGLSEFGTVSEFNAAVSALS